MINIKQRVIVKGAADKTVQENSTVVKKKPNLVCKGYRVLVVDDNAMNRKLATGMLKAYGYQIQEADSGQAAVELVKAQEFDMIFMDIMMPEMDGVEATGIIRTECKVRTEKPVIVALTANALRGARESYLENGFDDFLSKPFERMDLNELLARWIPEKRSE